MGVSVAVLLLLEKVMLAITADVRPAHNYVVTMLIICTKVQQQKKKNTKKTTCKGKESENPKPKPFYM